MGLIIRVHRSKLVDPSFMFAIKEQEASVSEYWLLLTTVDSGMGIPKDVQKKIFEPFVSNIDEASRKDYGVTGLGLAITKKLVELHGGYIMVTSQGIPGLGTSFHILLPHCCKKMPQEHRPTSPLVTQVNGIVTSIPNESAVISPDRPKSNGGHVVLCVDDDPINQRILCNILYKNGFQPIKAMNGEEALRILRGMRKMPDIILLDIMMPGIDGFEVCRIVRKEFVNSRVPIIFLSANNQREIIEKGYEVGADAFFSKPFDKVALLKIVSELMSKNTS